MLYQIKKKNICFFVMITFFKVSYIFSSGSPTGSTSYYGTHTYNNTASLHTTASSATLDSPLKTIDITQGIGALDIDVNASLQIQTGFEQWLDGGPYFDASTLGSFTLLAAGTGYIDTTPIGYLNGVAVGWTVPQTVTGLVAGNTYYIYIDDTGTLQKTTTDSNSLRTGNIVLFEVLRDSTSPTNIQYVVKENNSFRMPIATYEYLNNNVGPVIQNDNDGANIALNGTQKIQINRADVLNDSGLLTTIPDSGGVGVTWNQMFTNALGRWATSITSDTFIGQWNNTGTVTALSAGQYAVYTLYVGKDNLNSALPQYFAVLDAAQYASQVSATAAISAGTVSKATLELEAIDIAKLGYIIYEESSNSIVSVQIQKATLKSLTSSGGTNNASLVLVDTSSFDGILSAADTNVQAALDTIDEWGKNATNFGVLIGRGVNTPIAAVAPIATTGIPLVSQGLAADPAYTTAVVAGGGTGVTTMTTAYAPVISGTTPTGPLQVASTGLATVGYILTSNGAAAVPSFQSVASVGALTTLTGDTGGAISPVTGNINLFGSHGINTSGAGNTITTAVNNTLTLGDLSAVATGSPSLTLTTGDMTITSGNINLPSTSAAGADGVINVNATRFLHSFGTNNSFVGSGAGNYTLSGTASTGVGASALAFLSSGVNNTAVGASAGSTLSIANNTTAVGANALAAASGSNSTAVGYNALQANTGAQNTAVGSGALDANTSGTPNTAIGFNSLGANISGNNNVAVGSSAALSVLTGNNTAIGTSALAAASGADCTAVGYQAMTLNTAASNTAVGSQAMATNSSGTLNTAMGYKALNLNQTGIQNAAFGYQALLNSTTNNNTAFGSEVLQSTTSGANNTGVGRAALFTNQTGANNTGVGDHAFYFSTASSNTGVGSTAGQQTTTGAQNVAVGHAALFTNQTGANNVAVGYNALTLSTSSQNTAVGSGALDANTSGTPNTAVGYNALGTNISGANNTAVGANAQYALTVGTCTAVGSAAMGGASGTLGTATGGADSTAVGYNSLGSGTWTGANNTMIGSQAGATVTSGAQNTAVGKSALAAVTTTSNNTALGYQAGLVTTGTDNVYIGNIAGSTATTGSNNIFIGSGVAPFAAVTDTATTIIGNGSTAATYLRGVYGVTPATSGTVMLVDSASKFGAVTSQGTANQVLTSNGAGALPTWADNIIQTATVTLSQAQVLALNVTPIPVIAAPAAGKMIFVINAALKLTHVTTAFAGGGTIDLIYSGLSSDPIITGLGSNAFVTVGSNRIMGSVCGGQVSVASSSVEAVAVQVFNPGAAFTGGGTSTIKIMVNYVVLTTT